MRIVREIQLSLARRNQNLALALAGNSELAQRLCRGRPHRRYRRRTRVRGRRPRDRVGGRRSCCAPKPLRRSASSNCRWRRSISVRGSPPLTSECSSATCAEQRIRAAASSSSRATPGRSCSSSPAAGPAPGCTSRRRRHPPGDVRARYLLRRAGDSRRRAAVGDVDRRRRRRLLRAQRREILRADARRAAGRNPLAREPRARAQRTVAPRQPDHPPAGKLTAVPSSAEFERKRPPERRRPLLHTAVIAGTDTCVTVGPASVGYVQRLRLPVVHDPIPGRWIGGDRRNVRRRDRGRSTRVRRAAAGRRAHDLRRRQRVAPVVRCAYIAVERPVQVDVQRHEALLVAARRPAPPGRNASKCWAFVTSTYRAAGSRPCRRLVLAVVGARRVVDRHQRVGAAVHDDRRRVLEESGQLDLRDARAHPVRRRLRRTGQRARRSRCRGLPPGCGGRSRRRARSPPLPVDGETASRSSFAPPTESL